MTFRIDANNKLGLNKDSLVSSILNTINPQKLLTVPGRVSFEDATEKFGTFDNLLGQGLSQSDALSQMNELNTSFGRFIQTHETAKQSAQNYVAWTNEEIAAIEAENVAIKQSTLQFKAAAIAKQAFATVGNMVITAAATYALTFAIKRIDEYIRRQEIAIDKMNEAQSRIADIESAYKSHADLVNESAESYVKLREEIDRTNNTNLTLSDEEYNQFLDINQQFADAFPELISGFDNQGNAILNLGENADSSREKLASLLAQQRELADFDIYKNLGDEYGGMAAKLSQYNKQQDTISERVGNINESLGNIKELEKIDISDTATSITFNEGLNTEQYARLREAIAEYVKLHVSQEQMLEQGMMTWGYENELVDSMLSGVQNIDNGRWENVVLRLDEKLTSDQRRDLQNIIRERVNNIKNEYNDSLQNALSEKSAIDRDTEASWRDYVNNLAQGMQSQASFKDIESPELRDFAVDFVRNVDISLGSALQRAGDNFDYNYVRENILGNLLKLSDDKTGLDSFLSSYQNLINIKTKGLSPDQTVDDINKYIDNIAKRLNMTSPEDREQIVLSLGINVADIEDVESTFNKIRYRLGNTITARSEIDKETKDFTLEEKRQWNELNEGVKSYQEALDNLKIKSAVSIVPDSIIDISSIKDFSSSLSTIFSETSGIALTEDNINTIKAYYSTLESYDPSTLFEETANGIALNRQELQRLDQELQNLNLDEFKKKQEEVAEAYELLEERMRNMNKASEEYSNANRDLNALKARSKELQNLALQYAGATSAYQKFVQAQSTPDQSAAYVGVASKYDDMKKLAQQGRWGNDDLTSYLNIFSYEDTTNAGIEKQIELWKSLKTTIDGTNYSKLDFFKLDSNGNVTMEGANNLAKAISERFSGQGYAELDEKGAWNLDLTAGRFEEVAKAFDMSESALTLILQSLDEFGYHIKMDLDPAISSADKFGVSIDEAVAKLKNLEGQQFNLDVTTTDTASISSQITELSSFIDSNLDENGAINYDVEGMREALSVIDELILRQQQLASSEMQIMTVDVSQYPEQYRNVITNIQALETALQNISRGELLHWDQTEIDTYVEKAQKALKSIGDVDAKTAKTLNLEDLIKIDTSSLLDDGVIDKIQTAIGNISTNLPDSNVLTIEAATGPVDTTTYDNAKAKIEGTPVEFKIVGKVNTAETNAAIDSALSTIGKKTIDVKLNVSTSTSVSASKIDSKARKSAGLSDKAYGTASAYGRGGRGKDLVGELGVETVVDPHKGIYYTVGDNGAELIDLPKDAIVFNHWQTSQLFGRGRTSRGTAMAYGNAYADPNKYEASGSWNPFTSKQIADAAKKSAEEAKKAAKDAKDTAKDADDILSELSKQLDEIQSAYSTLSEIVDSYNENGKLTIDQAQALITTDFKYLALLTDENGKLKLNAQGFQDLAKTKLYEMQVQLARNALETVKSLTDEAKAAEFLKNSYKDLANAELSVEEAALRAAVAQKEALGGSQAEAAKKILAGYEATKKAIGNIDLSKEGFGIKDSSSSSKKDEAEEKRKEAYEKKKSKMEDKLNTQTFNWVERILENAERTIKKWTDAANKMYTFWNKNWAVNNALSANRTQIANQERAYSIYMQQATKAAKKAGMTVVGDDKKYTASYSGGYNLNKKYQDLVQNGAWVIQDTSNKTLASKISAYQEWEEKARSAKEAIEELYDTERELIRQKLDNILEYFDSVQKYYESITAKLDARVKLKESMGQRVSVLDLIQQAGSQAETANLMYKKMFQYGTGTSDVDKSLEEATARAVSQSYTKLIDSQYFKDLTNAASALNQSAKTGKTNKRALRQNTRNATVLGGNVQDTKLYRRIEKRLNKLVGKTSVSAQNKTNKYLAQISKLISTGNAFKNITGNEDVMNTATFNNIATKAAKIFSKTTLSKRNSNKLDMYLSEMQSIARYATTDNIAEYRTVYEQWYKLEQKRQKKGLNKKQQNTYDRLQNYMNSLQERRAEQDMLAERDYIKALSKLNPDLASLEQNLQWSEEDLIKSYNRQIQALQDEILGNSKYNQYASSSDPRKQFIAQYLRNGGTNANFDEIVKAAGYVYDNMGKSLSGKKASTYDNYKAYLESQVNTRQAEIEALQREMEDQLKKLEDEYKTTINELQADHDEAIAEAYDLTKSALEQEINLIKSEIGYLDTTIDQWEKLIDLYNTYDPTILRHYGLDVDTAKSSIELLRDGYNEVLADSISKLNKLYDERDAYQRLIDIATAKTANGKTDWSSVFTDYRNQAILSGNNNLLGYIAQLEELLSSNDYDDNTWVAEWIQELNNAKMEIYSTIDATQQLQDAFRENVIFKSFNDLVKKLETLQNKFAGIADYINDDWATDSSGLTEFGQTKVMQLSMELDSLREKADAYKEHLDEILSISPTDNGNYGSAEAQSEDYAETYQQYWEVMQNAESVARQIYELGKKQREAEISQIEKLINLRKQALQAKKDYYDYDRNIRNQTKDIQAIQAQIAALSNVNDAASKARLKQLQSDLEDKQDELENTRREHQYDVEVGALDTLIADMRDSLEDSAEDIIKTLQEFSDTVRQTILDSENVDRATALQKITDAIFGLRDGISLHINASDIDISDQLNKRSEYAERLANDTIEKQNKEKSVTNKQEQISVNNKTIQDYESKLRRYESLYQEVLSRGPREVLEPIYDASNEMIVGYKMVVESVNDQIKDIESFKPTEAETAAYNAATEANKVLNTEISDLNSEIKKLEANIRTYSEEIEALTKVLSEVQKQNSTTVTGESYALGGVSSGGPSLLGEVAPELVVDPHRGTYEVVGKNGAELRNLPKDAIVFNNEQTEELFSKGKIGSRGKAFANGANNNVAGLIASGILKPVGGGSRLSITPQLASALTDGSGAITKLVNEYNANNSYVASLIEGMQNYYSSMQSSMNHITRNFDARISDVVNAVNGLQNGSTVNPAMLAAMMSSNNGITYQQMKSMGMTVKYH